MSQLQEHNDFHYASDYEWDKADASELGAADPTQAWILTDRDVWHPNPYYVGEIVPHPEYDDALEEMIAEEGAREQERAAEEVIVRMEDVPDWPEFDWGDDIEF